MAAARHLDCVQADWFFITGAPPPFSSYWLARRKAATSSSGPVNLGMGWRRPGSFSTEKQDKVLVNYT